MRNSRCCFLAGVVLAACTTGCSRAHEPLSPVTAEVICAGVVVGGSLERTELFVEPDSAPGTCVYLSVREGNSGYVEGIETSPGTIVDRLHWFGAACGEPFPHEGLGPVTARGRFARQRVPDAPSVTYDVDVDVVLEGSGGGRELDAVLRTGLIRANGECFR